MAVYCWRGGKPNKNLVLNGARTMWYCVKGVSSMLVCEFSNKTYTLADLGLQGPLSALGIIAALAVAFYFLYRIEKSEF